MFPSQRNVKRWTFDVVVRLIPEMPISGVGVTVGVTAEAFALMEQAHFGVHHHRHVQASWTLDEHEIQGWPI